MIKEYRVIYNHNPKFHRVLTDFRVKVMEACRPLIVNGNRLFYDNNGNSDDNVQDRYYSKKL